MLNPLDINGQNPPKSESRPRQESSFRIYVLMVVFITGFLLVALKLATIQVRDSDKLKELARQQYESREIIRPTRGRILDRNLSILASNVTEYTVAVDPAVIEQPDTVAAFFARHLKGSRAQYLRKLTAGNRRFVIVEKNVGEDRAAAFRRWGCYGVFLMPSPKRKYNFNSLAGPLLGYTNVDNRGQSGIELAMDKDLAGQEGYIVYQLNALRYKRPEIDYPKRDPVDGRSVVLTIDQAYQAIAEEELQKGVEKHAAESGRCIVMNPKTGEVLAMANFPSIDLNRLGEYSPEKARNRAVTDLYEPGSTFKIVAMSAALNEHLYAPEDKLWAENGTWLHREKEKPIVDDHPFGWITLRGAFQHSSNIVSAKIAQQMGVERFYRYARNFGFGVKTGIELPGELHGDLRNPTYWDGSTVKYMAFGYGLAVTSLQIACAYSAIANDGVLMRPYIRKWLLDADRNIIEETVPQVVRRVVSSETAFTMRQFMQGVVDSGTARFAKIEGMNIGGKTGTSQRLVNGSYSNKSHVASFVGFFPVENPKVLILVILDNPSNGYYGGLVAAPIFREIALRIINSSSEFAKGYDPLYEASLARKGTYVPSIVGLNAAEAQEELARFGLTMRGGNRSGTVTNQNPSPGFTRATAKDVRIVTSGGAEKRGSGFVRIPDLAGLTLRQAVNTLKALRLKPVVVGRGVVAQQFPAAGTTIPRRSSCVISCEPHSTDNANVY